MKNTLFFILFNCLIIFCCKSQNYINYYNIINEAEYEMYNGDYEEAIFLLNQAFKIESPHPKDYYLLAICLDKNTKKNKRKIKNLLLKAAKENGSTTYWMKKNPLSIQLGRNFLAKLDLIETDYIPANKSIKDTIDYFRKKDQYYRKKLVDSVAVFYSPTDEEYMDYVKFSSKIDSTTQIQFLEYVQKNGYPGIFKSGSDISATILLHIHCSHFSLAKEILFRELMKGNIQPFFYGSMIDRINCACNEKAFYYAYPVRKECFGLTKKKIIENRKKIGMSPYFQGPRRFVDISKSKPLKISIP